MKKIVLATLALASLPAMAFAEYLIFPAFSAKDIENGVHCNINEANLLAKNEADCTKAGGKVAHTQKAAKEAAEKQKK